MVGVDPGDKDFDAANKEGGSKTVTLNAAIGAIENDTGKIGYATASAISNRPYNIVGEFSASTTRNPSYINHSVPVLQPDGKTPTTLQPYVTVYFWRRTA